MWISRKNNYLCNLNVGDYFLKSIFVSKFALAIVYIFWEKIIFEEFSTNYPTKKQDNYF